MIEKILFIFFGYSKKSNFLNQKPSVTSVIPNNKLNEDAWMKEFKVSSLYGKSAFKERIFINPNWKGNINCEELC